ncbi:MAG: RNA polymerase sigma factor [Bacteroidales bacterium]|nr:RNA polymerase sigma factor [Bacteroidales bacterium]
MNQKQKDIFSDLYRKYASYLYGVCLRYTKDKEDAEDVMQEGFIKIYNALEAFRGDANIKTWMQKIMVNTAINFYRHKKVIDFQSIEKSDVYWLKSDNEDVFSTLTAEELLNLMHDLPDGYRLVFNLYAIEGYKHREIAEMLNINEGTSKSQYSKARKMLQELAEVKLGIKEINVAL